MSFLELHVFPEAEVAALIRVSTLPFSCEYARRQSGVRSLRAEGELLCAYAIYIAGS